MFQKYFLTLLSFLFFLKTFAQKETIQAINWSIATQLPTADGLQNQLGLAGAISGIHHDVLLIAGGSNFENNMPWEGGKKKYYNDVYVLKKDKKGQFSWKANTYKLPYNLAYAAAASTPEGILCVGGENESGVSNEVFLLKWNEEEQNISIVNLPNLPYAVTNTSATVLSHYIYLAGGETASGVSNAFLSFDLNDISAGWKQLPPLPQPTSHAVFLAENKSLFLVGGRKKNAGGISDLYQTLYEFNIDKNYWVEKSKLPYALSAGTGLLLNSKDILLFGGDRGKTFHKVESLIAAIGVEKDEAKKQELNQQKSQIQASHPGFSKEVLRYNIMTQKWSKLNDISVTVPVTTLALLWGKDIIITCGETKAGVRTSNILMGKIKPLKK